FDLGETLEDRFELILRHARSLVGDDEVRPTRHAAGTDRNLRAYGYDAQGILEEIGQDLQDGASVGAHRPSQRIDFANQSHLTPGCLAAHPLQAGLDQLTWFDELQIQRPPGSRRANL